MQDAADEVTAAKQVTTIRMRRISKESTESGDQEALRKNVCPYSYS